MHSPRRRAVGTGRAMKVKDLIRELQTYNPNREVYGHNGNERTSKIRELVLVSRTECRPGDFEEGEVPHGDFLKIRA